MDLKKPDRSTLKGYFVKNAIPTASHFADLIESQLNQRDDGLAKPAGEPLSLQAEADAQKKVLNFYRSFSDDTAAWTLSLNPRAEPSRAESARAGWSIGNAAGESKFFIDQENGNVGIGTALPGDAKLRVAGSFNATANASGERAIAMEPPASGNHRGNGTQAATGLVYRVMSNPTAGDPIFQVRSQNGNVRFFAEHDGWTGSRDNSAWFGGARSNYFNGSVGIGTADPFGKLDVNGVVRVQQGASTAKDPDDAMQVGGALVIKSAAPQIDFVDTDNNDWAIHVNANKMYFIRQPWAYSDLVLDGKGNVGIGTADPAAMLHVTGTAQVETLKLGDKFRMTSTKDFYADDRWLRLCNGANSAYASFAALELYAHQGGLQQGSDLRLKRDVASLQHGHEKILKLRGVRFRWRDAARDDGPFSIGLVAQEVEEVFPEVVGHGPNGMKAINYAALVAPLIEAVKAQQAEIGELRAQVEALKAHG